MQIVILAGGMGTRLMPVTKDIPKPMVTVNGKPFLEYQLMMVKRQGFREILLCVGYLADKIIDYFGDGSRLGLKISYSVERSPLGTGGALRLAYDMLDRDFLLLNGDTYIDIPYRAVIDFYKKEGVDGVIVVYNNTLKLADNNVLISNDNNIISYGGGDRFNFVDAGVYVFNREIIGSIGSDKNISLEEGVIKPLVLKRSLRGFVTEMRYYDIGTFDRINIFGKEVPG